MRNQLLMGAAAAALVIPAAASAQETTAIVRGTVTSGGAPVVGADITITNTTTGARSTTTTDSSGAFGVSGLLPGGPYTVDIASASGNTSVTDVYTVVGQPYSLPIELSDASVGGNDIVITASSIAGAGRRSDGPQTVLSAEQIKSVASVNRDIRDLARRDPFARFEDTSGSGGGKVITFAGVNPRFNRFSIDGVIVSDNFGLNSDASPTRRGPVPFDAIGQFSTSVAPYDIRQGNFLGGAIDAVLKTGTNEFHGTGFYSLNTDGMTGDVRTIAPTAKPLDFTSKTYGATISGPIIKDKLFFMVSAERNTEGNPLSPVPGQVNNLVQANVDQIVSIADSVYNYNAGDYLTISNDKDEKIVGKLTWNISDRQKLSVSYINAYDVTAFLQNTNAGVNTTSNPGSIGLSSNGYQLTELLRAGTAQLNSDWSDNFSTEVRFLYKSYDRGQNALGAKTIGQMRVCSSPTSIANPTVDTVVACGPNPIITLGPDVSRQSNVFFTDTYSGSFLARWNQGNHELKLLAEYNEVRIFNLFLQNTLGNYYFDSIADFQAGKASSVTYQNTATGDPNAAAANFKYAQWTFGFQDDWRVSDRLSFTFGVRYDLYGSRSPVPLNDGFTARYGYPNTLTYKGLGLFQPRAGFSWEVADDVRVRGGIGIFGGGSPDVYLSNSYSNAGAGAGGVSINSVNVTRCIVSASCTTGYQLNGANISAAAATPYLTYDPNHTALQTQIPNTGPNALANLNALDKNFRIPNVTKGTLSIDWTPRNFLGGGWNFGADFYWSKTNSAPYFYDARSVVVGKLPDGRDRYGPLVGTNTNTDIVLTSTSKGRSYIGVVRMAKSFDFGLDLNFSYTVQDVKDATPATSSTANSNYTNGSFLGAGAAYGAANDQTAWSFKYGVGFNHAFFGDYKTRIQLFGSTNAGRPFSYTMTDLGSSTRSVVFGLTGRDDRYLLYVPTGVNDPLVDYVGGPTGAAATSLDTLINSTDLKNYRGKIAPRNIARSRAYTQMDLHLEQEIPTFIGKSRITLFGDIQNLPNLLNKDWGQFRQVAFPYIEDVISVQCLSGTGVVNTSPTQTCAKYQYSLYTNQNRSIAEIKPSLYFVRIGARFTF